MYRWHRVPRCDTIAEVSRVAARDDVRAPLCTSLSALCSQVARKCAAIVRGKTEEERISDLQIKQCSLRFPAISFRAKPHPRFERDAADAPSPFAFRSLLLFLSQDRRVAGKLLRGITKSGSLSRDSKLVYVSRACCYIYFSSVFSAVAFAAIIPGVFSR